MLTVQGLNFSCGSIHAVRDVSFGIGAGEVNGLLGPSGRENLTFFGAMYGVQGPC